VEDTSTPPAKERRSKNGLEKPPFGLGYLRLFLAMLCTVPSIALHSLDGMALAHYCGVTASVAAAFEWENVFVL